MKSQYWQFDAARYLHGLDLQLSEQTGNLLRSPVSDLAVYESDIFHGSANDYHQIVWDTFERATQALDAYVPAPGDNQSSYPLVRAVASAALHRSDMVISKSPMLNTCFEVEPLILQSLASLNRQRPGILAKRSALMIFGDDTDEAPLAYAKPLGGQNAYTLCSGWLYTQDGRVWLPADSIFSLHYPEQTDPSVNYEGVGAVSVVTKDTPPDRVAFKRFSTELMDPGIVHTAVGNCYPDSDIHDFILPGGINREDIARQVYSILRKGSVVRAT